LPPQAGRIAETTERASTWSWPLCTDDVGQSRKAVNEKNRPVLLLPLDALNPDLQRKYMAQHKAELPIEAAAIKLELQPLDQFSADERVEIQFWSGILSKSSSIGKIIKSIRHRPTKDTFAYAPKPIRIKNS